MEDVLLIALYSEGRYILIEDVSWILDGRCYSLELEDCVSNLPCVIYQSEGGISDLALMIPLPPLPPELTRLINLHPDVTV